MEKHLSNAQIDRLGDRLRRQQFGRDDVRMLDEYRLTFGSAYDVVVERLQLVSGLPVSGRPAKSTTSIIDKLNRESIRLSQVQDIAGCRTTVDDLVEQDRLVHAIASQFEDVTVVDRRAKPSHGYRAVHVIIREGKKPIEVQIRTSLQHVWAEMCEKFADVEDPAVKYGGGSALVRGTLDRVSRVIESVEVLEADLARRGAPAVALYEEVRSARKEYLRNLQNLLREPIEPEDTSDDLPR